MNILASGDVIFPKECYHNLWKYVADAGVIGPNFVTWETDGSGDIGVMSSNRPKNIFTKTVEKINKKKSTLEKCSACGKGQKDFALTYKMFKIERKICKGCFNQSFDKIFGIKSDNELEKILHD